MELKAKEHGSAGEVREYGSTGPNYWRNCQVQGLMARVDGRKGGCFLYWNSQWASGNKHSEENLSRPVSSGVPLFGFLGQADVPCFEDQRVRLGSKCHVLLPVGLRSDWWPPLEVRQWRMGASWETRAAEPQLCLHPPRLSQLWGPLDESCHFLQQSQTYQQAQWEWAGMAWCFHTTSWLQLQAPTNQEISRVHLCNYRSPYRPLHPQMPIILWRPNVNRDKQALIGTFRF